MIKVIYTLVVCVFLIASCASQSPETADGEPLPAPVREASVVAVEEPQPLPVQAVEVLPSEPLNSAQSTSSTSARVEQSSPIDTASMAGVAPIEPISEPAVVGANASSIESVDAGIAEGATGTLDQTASSEVEGLVQVALSEDEIVLAADVENSESDVATYLLDEAENSFERQNYEKARGQSERALALEPTAARAYLILARIEIELDSPDQAAEMARQGLASSEGTDQIFEQLNQILGQLSEMPSSSVEASGLDTPQEAPLEGVDTLPTSLD